MNKTRCKETVSDGAWEFHQCSRKIWKDGYCKQHHPDTVKARQAASKQRWEEQREKEPRYLLQEANKRIAELEAEIARLKNGDK